MKQNTKKWLITAVWGMSSILTGLLALYTDHPAAWIIGGMAYLRFYYLVWTTPIRGFEEFVMKPVAIWVNATITLLVMAWFIPFQWGFIPAVMSLALMIYEIIWGKRRDNHE